MQVQKDVLIAGGVVVVCVALVIVALVATTGKKDKPTDSMAHGGDTFGSSMPAPSLGADPMAPMTSDPGMFGGTSSRPPTTGGIDPGAPWSSSPLGGTSSSTPLGGITSSTPLGGTSSSTDLLPLAGTSAPTYSPTPAYSPSPSPSPLFGGSTTTTAASESAGGGTHTIAKNETLGDISASHYGSAKHWSKIKDANPGLDPQRLKIGQVIQIPVVASAPRSTTAGTADGVTTYKVLKGESYYIIAKKVLGSANRWRELERLNGTPAEELRAGTIIKLPSKDGPGTVTPGGGGTHIVGRGETYGDISKQYFGTTTKWKQIEAANPGVSPTNLKVGQSLNIPALPVEAAAPAVVYGNGYTVKKGDTLESIAAAQLGRKSAWKQIVDANPGLDPKSLRIGQQIAIPGAATTPAGTDSGASPIAPGPGAPAPFVPPQPTYKDDLFYSPFEVNPAPGGTTAPSRPLGAFSANSFSSI